MSSTTPATRLACDRCHSKKIRCIIQGDSKACVRCLKQGLRCHFSPPAKTGRPAHSKMRRTNTAPSPSLPRNQTSPTFSVTVPSESMSLSPSPATSFPSVAPRTPSIDTNVQQAPNFYDTDSSYPLFGGPIVVEPSSYNASTADHSDAFQEQTLGFLTPISVDQGYEGACTSVMTSSSFHSPFSSRFGEFAPEPVTYHASAPPPTGFTHDQLLNVSAAAGALAF